MFNFGKIKFRVVTKYSEEAVTAITELLRRDGFKIGDLRESSVIADSDGSKIEDVYIVCCEGSKRKFNQFKQKHDFDEIMYEGFRTLM